MISQFELASYQRAVRTLLSSPLITETYPDVHALPLVRRWAVFYSKIGFVALVGESMDLEIVELLATSLLVQATRATTRWFRAARLSCSSARGDFQKPR